MLTPITLLEPELLLTQPPAPGTAAVSNRSPARKQWGCPKFHLFSAASGHYLLMADGSRVYQIEASLAGLLRSAEYRGDQALIDTLLEGYGLSTTPYVDDAPLRHPPLRSLSLAVAQKCNLGCTYCYAQGGDFGAPAQSMSLATALQAVARLFADVQPGDRVNLAFMGGEPLVNRPVLRAATEHAVHRAAETDALLGLAITTNGTLVSPDDAAFFEHHAFSVTVSLDGVGAAHDRLRPFKDGRSSYATIVERIRPLLQMQQRMQVSARVTVTPRNLGLRDTLDELIGLGFDSVGFSPMLSSPTGRDQMADADLETMLDQMIACGQEFERRLIARERYPFFNIVSALAEIHKGTHRPYPCGAGAGYFGVSADGELAACHRFVNDALGGLGNLTGGVDRARQEAWLAQHHVHYQEPCRSCWARYLCGGGCYHEVARRGRMACVYIRGWLDYCLQAYVRLLEACPDYFDATGRLSDPAPAQPPSPER